MRKIISLLVATLLMTMTVAYANPVVVPISITPIQTGNNAPEVFEIDRDQPRTENYLFTGEEVVMDVLVRDIDGSAVSLSGYVDGNLVLGCPQKTLADVGGQSYVESQTGLTYNSATDRIYKCTLTTQSNWVGEKEVTVKAYDGEVYGEYSFGDYNFNPTATISVTTTDLDPLTFGTMDSNRIATSNDLVITNSGDVDALVFIAGTNFYQSETYGICPTSNVLEIDNFEYGVGSVWTSIPNYVDSGSCTSTSCYGGDLIPNAGDANSVFNVGIRLVFPSPCSGTYDNGDINIIVTTV